MNEALRGQIEELQQSKQSADTSEAEKRVEQELEIRYRGTIEDLNSQLGDAMGQNEQLERMIEGVNG